MATKKPGKPAHSKKGDDEKKYLRSLRNHQRRLLKHPEVTSVGVGYRVKDGKRTDELCIQCTVDRKLAPESLSKEGRSPLPSTLKAEDGTSIPVDVIQRNFSPSYRIENDKTPEGTPDFDKKRREFCDPLVPGVSVSNINGSAGSIGAFVFDKETGEPLLLSNWHVLDNGGSIGDVIVQPGPYDNPDINNNGCGTLLRSHLGLAGDCAVARITSRDFDTNILELNRIPRRMAEPELDDLVVKSGRTTGVTYGIVSRVGVVTKLDYGGSVGIQEIGGFEIRPNPKKQASNGEISMGGDSGSFWLIDVQEDHDDADVVVGLHFAGETDPSPDEEHAVACRITTVAKKMNIGLEPVEEHLTDERHLWREVFDRLERLEIGLQKSWKHPETSCSENRASVDEGPAAVPEAGIPVHGNWCGPGHGGGQPVDELDVACMQHDQCYDRKGYLDCGCDKKLVGNITSLVASRQLNAGTLAKALVISGWFSNSPCVRHVRIGGKLVSLPWKN